MVYYCKHFFEKFSIFFDFFHQFTYFTTPNIHF